MNLTKDNAFVGAKVSHQTEGENLYVYKVNDKSFYAGAMPWEKVEEFNDSGDYSTFSKLMEAVNGKQYQYKDFILVEDKIVAKNQRQYLTEPVENLIKELYDIKQSGKGSWDHSSFVNKVHVILIASNNDGKCVVRSGNDVVFYDIKTGTQKLFNSQKDKFGKKIIWENFQIS